MTVLILGNQSRSVYNFWSVLIRHLLAEGHTVLCAVPDSCAPKEREAEEDARGRLERAVSRLLTYPLSRKGLNPFADLRTLWALYRLFRAEHPDLLFTSTIKPVIYGSLAAHFAGVPRIYATITGLGYTFERDSVAKRAIHALAVFLYRTSLAHVSGVFFQNEDDRATFREAKILGENAKIFMARGTGVDTGRFAYVPAKKPDPEFLFLFVGRLLVAKGLDAYAQAAKLLRDRYPMVRFQIVGPKESGPGALPSSLLDQWVSQGLIEYLGETRDVRPYLAACHVLVLPSWREGTPTAVMEAMSVGRACIVTDVPGCREVVRNGENGYVVPVNDAEALAHAMEQCVTEYDRTVAMGIAGREMACREFDADRVAEKILLDMQCCAANGCDHD